MQSLRRDALQGRWMHRVHSAASQSNLLLAVAPEMLLPDDNSATRLTTETRENNKQ